jgi:Ni,Fe-hydrogenase III large subunit
MKKELERIREAVDALETTYAEVDEVLDAIELIREGIEQIEHAQLPGSVTE